MKLITVKKNLVLFVYEKRPRTDPIRCLFFFNFRIPSGILLSLEEFEEQCFMKVYLNVTSEKLMIRLIWTKVVLKLRLYGKYWLSNIWLYSYIINLAYDRMIFSFLSLVLIFKVLCMVLYVKNKRRVEKMKCTSNRDSNVIDKMCIWKFFFLSLSIRCI